MDIQQSNSQGSPKLELLWEQDFTQAADGTKPSDAYWTHDIGDGTEAGIPGWGNQEREWYDAESAKTQNGSLVFTANRQNQPNDLAAYYGPAEWTSAKIHTNGKVHVHYGRVEATIKAPIGNGTWPAFWMLGTDLTTVGWPECGEIDILEMRGRDPHTLISTVHGPGYFVDKGSTTEINTPNLTEDFHTYSIDWMPDEIVWRFDGEPFHRVTPETVAPNRWAFNHPFYIILNLAMGGGFTGEIDPALNQAEMAVQSIRVYSIDGVGEVTKH